MAARWAIALLWLAWLAAWQAMARRGKAEAGRLATAQQLQHRVPSTIAAILLVVDIPVFPLDARLVPAVGWPPRLGLALVVAGLAFALWARLHLAGNWSANVTLKRGHELVADGPYRWVRHPIYTGVLAAVAGTALAIGEGRALLALALAVAALWRKLTLEEVVMRRQFGDAYVRYAERTRALIPFVL